MLSRWYINYNRAMNLPKILSEVVRIGAVAALEEM